jgi:Domain of unknown function (DUF4337)
MALGDTLLNQLRKSAEKNGDIQTASSKLKSKAALIISVFAAIYSVNAFIGGQLSSKILNTTIEINDTYSFYQAKSIKQTQYEIASDDVEGKDQQRYLQYRATVERYENEPNEGKKALLAKARNLEHERDIAKKKSPFIGIAGSIMQIAIVLLTASILSAGTALFWGGLVAMAGALALMAQGLFLFF